MDPADAGALSAEADVGVRWLVKAHPAPDLFIAQVGDERDHDRGFRDPADDDASTKPGIGTRFAYPEVGGDLGGKAATALALAYRRTGDAVAARLREGVVRGGQGVGTGGAAASQGGLSALRRQLLRRQPVAGLARRRRGGALPRHVPGGRVRRLLPGRLPHLHHRRAVGRRRQPGRGRRVLLVRRRGRVRRLRRRGRSPAMLGTIGCDLLRQNGKIAVRRRGQERLRHARLLHLGDDGDQRRQRGARGARDRRPAGPGRRLRGRGRGPRLPARPQPVRAQLRRRLRAPGGAPPAHLGLGLRPRAAARRRAGWAGARGRA